MDKGQVVVAETNEDEIEDGEDSTEETTQETTKVKTESKTFSQDDLNRALARRLRRERDKLKGEVREELEREQKLSKAEQDGDLKAVVEDLRKKLSAKENADSLIEEYESLAQERYDAALADLPEHLRDLAPDDDEPIIIKERWLTKKAIPAAAKWRADQEKNGETKEKAKKGLNPKDPKSDDKTRDAHLKDLIKGYDRSGMFKPLA